jgi:hypothetical protein
LSFVMMLWTSQSSKQFHWMVDTWHPSSSSAAAAGLTYSPVHFLSFSSQPISPFTPRIALFGYYSQNEVSKGSSSSRCFWWSHDFSSQKKASRQTDRQAGRHMINPNRPNIIPQNKVYQSPFTKQTWRNVKRPIPSPQELWKKKVAAQRLSIKPIS